MTAFREDFLRNLRGAAARIGYVVVEPDDLKPEALEALREQEKLSFQQVLCGATKRWTNPVRVTECSLPLGHGGTHYARIEEGATITVGGQKVTGWATYGW